MSGTSRYYLDYFYYYVVSIVAMQQPLGEFEQLVMFAVMRLDDEAYGASIRAELLAQAGRDVSPGAIFTTLERLEARGLVTSTYGDPTPERGGRRKRFYRVLPEGRRALAASLETIQRMAHGLHLGEENS